MVLRKMGLEQMGRQYLYASNLEMARLIVAKTGIYSGRCLELTTGVGYLGYALAESTMLDVFLLGNNRDTVKLTEVYLARNRMQDRIKVVKGSSCAIPLPDASMDLVTSSQSVFTWNNRVKIFREVYRVLAPGGTVCFCGGFEPADVRMRIETRLAEVDPKLVSISTHPAGGNRVRSFEKVLKQAGIASYEIQSHSDGMWILFQKPALHKISRGPVAFTYLGPPVIGGYHPSETWDPAAAENLS